MSVTLLCELFPEGLSCVRITPAMTALLKEISGTQLLFTPYSDKDLSFS